MKKESINLLEKINTFHCWNSHLHWSIMSHSLDFWNVELTKLFLGHFSWMRLGLHCDNVCTTWWWWEWEDRACLWLHEKHRASVLQIETSKQNPCVTWPLKTLTPVWAMKAQQLQSVQNKKHDREAKPVLRESTKLVRDGQVCWKIGQALQVVPQKFHHHVLFHQCRTEWFQDFCHF